MAEETGIAWTDSTFNPWRGCMKVSEGCKNCYAEQLVTKRQGLPVWGQDAQRIVAAESTWKNPVRWNKEVAAKPYQCTRCHKRSPDKTAYCLAMIEPDDNDLQDALKLPRRSPKVCGGEVVLKSSSRVFCASLADIFERYEGPAMDAVWAARTRLFVLVKDTPNLTWQFLTKRPENIMDMVPQSWGSRGRAMSGSGARSRARSEQPSVCRTCFAFQRRCGSSAMSRHWSPLTGRASY